MERTIYESHSGGSSDAPRGTTPATPPAERVDHTANSKLKIEFFHFAGNRALHLALSAQGDSLKKSVVSGGRATLSWYTRIE
jgi:hypothetical protein